jgi:2-C-methyl-D-erythritol 2,4-cyclodiphosphate synthase
MTFRTGIGFDVHRFAPGRPLVLGGVSIPGSDGLEGHSDADVVVHAMMDALLGAVADGDIGQHFPNTDPRWKGANSLDLLAAVVARLRSQGWRPVNVDATVIAERPRVMPHAAAMRRAVSAVLGTSEDAVSVKATTPEHMGALGRGEGVAVMAVALVEKE